MNIKLSFKTAKEFSVGIDRLSEVLGYEIGDGVEVNAVKGERIGAEYKNGKAVIYYKEKHHFWRSLAKLVDCIKKNTECDTYEDTAFKTVGVMICVSRGMVPTLKTLEKYLDYMAVMGYNLVMLQTDDLFELENRPYFGYMRGRYTKEEQRAFDNYAFEYGIEAIPCIECYSHMKTYLMWDEAAELRDTASVLMAREEKTFAFVEEMISEISSCYRSKRIHIGMDEAWDMGRGNFLTKYGKVPILDIFNEYMERLIKITDKYGLKPMMWSDMYFRTSRDDNKYYSEDTVVPEATKKAIPEGVELVFWHYGEEPECDYYMLEQHKTLDRPIIFAGGLWDWAGHFPNNDRAYEATEFSIGACRANGIDQMLTTAWFIDSECELFSTLLGLSQTAALVYEVSPSEEYRRERFELETGGSFDAFNIMSRYHNKCDGRKYEDNNAMFLGKHLFWQDIMEGVYDTILFREPMSEHYEEAYKMIKSYRCDGDKWDYLYEYCEAVFAYLSNKCYIAERLVPSYRAGDRDTLSIIASELLPRLKEQTERIHKIYRSIWFMYNKDFAFIGNDVHYGGMAARIDFSIIKLRAYLEGECEKLEQLEEPRLDKPVTGFTNYYKIASPIEYI